MPLKQSRTISEPVNETASYRAPMRLSRKKRTTGLRKREVVVNIIGSRVASVRRKQKLSQLALSRLVNNGAAGLDRAAIAKIENSLRQVRDFEVVALAKALKVTPLWLLTGRR